MTDEKPTSIPEIAGNGPMKVELEARTTYSFCPCGRSQKQPFCDGAHRDVTDFKSIKFTSLRTETVSLCLCKHSKTLPYCDGSHKDVCAQNCDK